MMTSSTSVWIQRGVRAALLGSVVLGLSGCFAGVKPPRDKLVQLAWPDPPEKTRIKFVGNLTGEHELKAGLNWRDSLSVFLSGRPRTGAELSNPLGIAVSNDAQRAYVTDLSQASIFVFDLPNRKVTTWKSEQTKVSGPVGVALDADENVYVVDTYEKVVRVFDRNGTPLRTIAYPNAVRITGIAIDQKRGRVFVSDTSHQKSAAHRVLMFDLQGQFLKEIGKGKGSVEGYFLFPTYLTVDADGHLYVTDTMNARVQVFDPDSGDVLRTYGQRGNGYGMFERPKGVALDSFGNVYVADSAWSNVQIFNKDRQVLLFFGGRGGYPGLLNNPSAIAIDKDNRIWVADTQNRRLNLYQLVNTTSEDSMASATGSEIGAVSAR